MMLEIATGYEKLAKRADEQKPRRHTVREAVQVLLNRISGVPVVDDSSRLVGILSEGDLLRRSHDGAWPKAWGRPSRNGGRDC